MMIWSVRRRGAMLVVCGGGLLLCTLVVLHLALQQGCECDCPPGQTKAPLQPSGRPRHKLAVIVPFRDRFEELQEFIVHISKFLGNQGVNHRIFIINQVDSLRFNRASLLNVGFLELPNEFDYIAMHDVDLLPNTRDLHYSYPDTGPLHLAAPHLHPRYHYPTFIGGVLLISRAQFVLVNGLSNQYWGWGMEDDEFYSRLREAQLTIQRPGNLTTGTKSFRHIHDRRVRRRDEIRCYDQHLLTRRRDRGTGLSTVQYSVVASREVTVDGAKARILNVALECSKKQTPWCDCKERVGNSPKEKWSEIMAAVAPEDIIAPKLNRKKHLTLDA